MRPVAAMAVILLASCGHLDPGDAVRDADAAIAIGRAVCVKGLKNPPPAKDWYAVLSGDSWKVWLGPHDRGYGRLEVLVAKRDGKPTDCLVQIG